ncbi:MAG: alpha/beta fold hydrolase [Actinomycetota bacterium]
MTADPYHWTHGDDDAPLLLCLHGIGSCADAFGPQRPLAERSGRRVAAWDAPGYRHSSDPATEPGIDGWVDAAVALIEVLGVEEADVLGVSWGGVIATRMALRHPGRIRSLVLADSSPGAGTTPAQAAAMRERAAEVTTIGLSAFAQARTPKLVHPDTSTALLDEIARLMVDAVRMPPYQWAANAMADVDHRPDLHRIGCPTLVVVGDADTVTGVDAAEALAEGIPGAGLAVIDRAGHLANQERPEAFNDVVATFLAGVDAA